MVRVLLSRDHITNIETVVSKINIPISAGNGILKNRAFIDKRDFGGLDDLIINTRLGFDSLGIGMFNALHFGH